MSLKGREKSSSLFIISEGQFYSKPSIKLERLEKDYSDLKRKENEDEIELRRLRTENLLLKQRIDNLEKESMALADKLVQDQVAWAQHVEQLFAVRARLSTTLRQLRESQNQLHDSENTVEDLSKKNQICTDQIRRVGADNKKMKKLLEEITQDKKAMQTHINVLTRKLDATESTRKAEAIMARIKDAEHMQQMAELRRKLAEMDIQKVETLIMSQIRDQRHNHTLVTSSSDLKNQSPAPFIEPGMFALHGHRRLTNSQLADDSELSADGQYTGNSDDEFDALIRDSENLERALSDIIEGRHNSVTISTHGGQDGNLSDSKDCCVESSKSKLVNSLPESVGSQTYVAAQVEPGTCVSGEILSDTVVDVASVEGISDGKVDVPNAEDIVVKIDKIASNDDTSDDNLVGIANVNEATDNKVIDEIHIDNTFYGEVNGVANIDDNSDNKVTGKANIIGRTDDRIVGLVNIDCADNVNKSSYSSASDDIREEKIGGASKDDVTTNKDVDSVANIDDFTDEKLHVVACVEDVTNDNIVGVVNCYITDDDIVGESNIGVVVKAKEVNVDVTQCEGRIRRVRDMEQDDFVYASPGGVGAVMSLFGYKGEASLMLKESAI